MSEYSDELIFKCKTNFYQGFKSIYESVAKKTINKKYILRDFQNALEFVPLWNTNIIDTEYKRFKKNTRCGWLDDLIQASFLNMAKELLKNTENKSSIQLVIPSGPNFIHKCYINIAREIWKNPKLFYQKVSRDELKDNIEDIYDIISEQILHTLRNDLPFKDVLHSYLNKQNTVSNEVEEDEYSDSDIEDSSLSNTVTNETKQIDTVESNQEDKVGVVKHIENDEGDSLVTHGSPSMVGEKEADDEVSLDSVSVSGEPSVEDEKEADDEVSLDSVSVSGEPSVEDEKEEDDEVALDSVSVSGEPSVEDEKEEDDEVALDSVSVSGEPSVEDEKEADGEERNAGDSNMEETGEDSGEIKTGFEETTKSDISKFAEDTTEPGGLNHDNVSPESTATKAPREDTFYEKSKVEPSDSDTESIEIDMNDIEQKLYLSDEEDTRVAKKRNSEVKPLNLASLRNETTNDDLKYVNIHGKEVYRNVEDAHTIDASESLNDNVKAIRII
jgi:hypothetical protein